MTEIPQGLYEYSKEYALENANDGGLCYIFFRSNN